MEAKLMQSAPGVLQFVILQIVYTDDDRGEGR